MKTFIDILTRLICLRPGIVSFELSREDYRELLLELQIPTIEHFCGIPVSIRRDTAKSAYVTIESFGGWTNWRMSTPV